MGLSRVEAKAWAIAMEKGWYEVVSNFIDISLAYQKLGKHVPSPLRESKHGDGFRLLPKFDDCGEAVDNSLGFCPNGLDLVALALGATREEAAKAIINIYESGAEFQVKKKPKPKPQRKERTFEEKVKYLNKLMSTCVFNPNAISLYMRSRGVEIPQDYMPKDVFYSKEIELGTRKKKYHGLVCAVTNKEGKLRTSHRIILNDHFGKNTDLKKAKLVMPAPSGIKGGLIRAYPVLDFENPLFIHGVRGFTEGLEDAIVCTIATKVPCAAGVSSTVLQNADFEENIHTGVIFGDNDPAGRKAAMKLATKLMNEGKKAIIVFPMQKGKDWNDIFAETGSRFFPNIKRLMNGKGKVFVSGPDINSWGELKETVNKDIQVHSTKSHGYF